MRPFSDAAVVANYVESTRKKVPGLADLHRMTMLLLAEQVPSSAKLLVVGAGGGLELAALCEAQPSWTFVGVDPSAEMLELASQVLAADGSRVTLMQGYIDSVPPGPFDGATCLLTLHFLAREERLRTLREIRGRLRPGAPLVVAHHSCPQDGDIHRWLSRSAAFAHGPGIDAAQASSAARFMAQHLPLLSTDDEENVLREAGFCDVALFYAAFSFRGWVASSCA